MTASRIIAGLAALAALGAALFYASNYHLFILAMVCLTATVGVGLNVLVGLNGQISLGHVAFYAIGAYAVGITTTAGILNFWLALPFAALLAGIAGGLLSIPALRVRGPYLAMLTIAFGFVVEQAAAEWVGLTGGWNGLLGIEPPHLADVQFAERGIALLSILMLLVALWFYATLSRSRWGLAMRAVRDSETAAQSIGLNPVLIRSTAFAISAAAAGAAGGVFAVLNNYISPESFPFSQSILFLLVVMVGGAEAVLGPVIGAIIVVLLPELLSWLAEYRLLFVGILLLLVLRLAPGGFAGLFTRFVRTVSVSTAARSVGAVDIARILGPASGEGIEGRRLSIEFGGVRAVNDLSFTARRGRVTSLVGPNGAGKSTALNLLCGFYRPDAGEVVLDGQALPPNSPHVNARAGLARTYQTTQLFASMSVLDNVLIALAKGRLTAIDAFRSAHRKKDCEVASALLKFVGYAGSPDIPAGALPHVDKRLVEIARALALQPSIIALDEPAAGLNPDDTARLGGLLRQLAAAGRAVILIEHDMNLVMSASDHLIVLDAGTKIAEGLPADVARDPRVLSAYLGEKQSRDRARPEPLPRETPVVLRTSELSAGYGAIQVIRDVSMEVAEGELVAVLGANGAGKSTLMRSLAGLNRPIGGRVEFLGRRIEKLSANQVARQRLVLVPEGRQVFPELSTIDNLRMGAMTRTGGDIEAEVEKLLDRFPRLRERAFQRAGLLSGGEQQMLAIARGLIARPRLLLLDEPSLGLAPMLVDELYDLIGELRDSGTTVILADQNASLALSVADRAYVLRTGTIANSGKAADLLSDDAIASAYLGTGMADAGQHQGERQ